MVASPQQYDLLKTFLDRFGIDSIFVWMYYSGLGLFVVSSAAMVRSGQEK